jgi:hypothetical protein
VLELKTGTSADVVSGGWMEAFGGTIWSVGAVDNVAGTIDQIADALTAGSATGSGTMFTVAFHAKAASLTPAHITIRSPNTATTYLLDADLTGEVHIDAVVNGEVTVPIPPATSPKAIITSPADGSTVTVGDTVNLVGTSSTGGIDSVPPAEVCLINSYTWTVDFHNTTILVLLGATQSFVCGGAGTVTITLTVIAPDPTPGDSNYVDHDTSAPVTVYQALPYTGPNIDIYTDRGGIGHLGDYPYSYAWSDAYGPQEEVCVYAKVTYNGAPVEYKPVEFVFVDPFGAERGSRTAFTNATGIAKVCFRIPWQGSDAEAYFGNWTIYGTVSISEVQVYDAVKFPFGYILYIKSISIANPLELRKGDTMHINVTISSIAIWATYPCFLQITAVDNCNVPIGLATTTFPVPPAGYVSVGNTILIQPWAYAGLGTVYVNLLGMGDIAPSWASVPYCPEKTATFQIVFP